MKISVLGCGWLGLPTAKALLREGHQVLGSTRSLEKQKALQKEGIDSYLMNLNDLEELAPALLEASVFFVNIPPGRRDLEAIAAYPNRIAQLLSKIRAHHTAQQQKPWVIFASSTGVYDKTEPILTETTTCQPERNSAKAIYTAEQVLAQFTKVMDFTILRFAGLVGGSRQAGRFMAGKKNLSMGDKAVNLVHLDDCVAILTQLIAQNLRQEIFNICADQHPLHRDFYPFQAQKLGLEVPTYTEDSTEPSAIVANQKIKTALDYSFIWPDPMLFP